METTRAIQQIHSTLLKQRSEKLATNGPKWRRGSEWDEHITGRGHIISLDQGWLVNMHKQEEKGDGRCVQRRAPTDNSE